LKLKPQTVVSISSLLIFTLAGLIGVSFFAPDSIFAWLNRLVVRYFGWGGFLLPIWIVGLGMIPLQRRRSRRQISNLVLGGLLITISFLSLTASFVSTHSGLFGKTLWLVVASKLTSAGAILAFFVVGLIGIVVFFNTSFEEVARVLEGWYRSNQSRLSKVTPRNLFGFLSPDLGKLFKQAGDQSGRSIKIGGSVQKPVLPETALSKKAEKAKSPQKDLESRAVQNVPLQGSLWQPPSPDILDEVKDKPADRGDIRENATIIERTLESFGISAKVVEVNLGPAVTQYALEIAMGTKLSKITALSNDLALALAAPTGQIRIEAPIPGRSLVGIEIPNRSLELVTLKRLLTSDSMRRVSSKLAFGLGLDVSGTPVIADLSKMPHLLIAGATGSGKSVCVSSVISCYLFRTSPQELRIILVDPKRVELVSFDGIPHLLTPVIVEVDQALSALRWAISEMDRRYKLFAGAGARNIDVFNQLSGFQALPYLVIFIDELADLMAFAPADFEDAITRLAQMARATGIHLVLSTQRPSIEVITGLIKANIPARIAFAVSSLVDSRVIIDIPGAEKLLGRGDMLFLPPDRAKPLRVQGTFVSDREIGRLVRQLNKAGGIIEYSSEVTEKYATSVSRSVGAVDAIEERDEFFEEAVRLACQADKASASLFQRRLKIGYARAARILDQLEAAGVVGPAEGSKPREVLIREPEQVLTPSHSSSSDDASV
jgi:S-DNA-T family DNA segregation ATPase FtsK/SpoIIIE